MADSDTESIQGLRVRMRSVERENAEMRGRLTELGNAQGALVTASSTCTTRWDKMDTLLYGSGPDAPGLMSSFVQLRSDFQSMRAILRWGLGLLTVVTAAVLIDVLRGGGAGG